MTDPKAISQPPTSPQAQSDTVGGVAVGQPAIVPEVVTSNPTMRPNANAGPRAAPSTTKHMVGIGFATYSGPLPPPQMLIEYNKAIPNAAERILRMAEEQSAHRRQLETKAVSHGIINARLGLVAGLIVSLGCLAVAAYCIRKGADLTGFAVVITTIGGLVYTFLSGKKASQKDLSDKSAANQPPLESPAAQK